MERLQAQKRASETMRALSAKSVVPAEDDENASRNEKDKTEETRDESSLEREFEANGANLRRSEEDDPDLRLAISLSLGNDW